MQWRGHVVTRNGRLDCLVSAAGIGSDISFLQTSSETFDRIIAVNLWGTFIVGQAAARVMRKRAADRWRRRLEPRDGDRPCGISYPRECTGAWC
jgi:NAD(P)-dependent dehydrogenase (short-subunit alcohol dehydrogenase family)